MTKLIHVGNQEIEAASLMQPTSAFSLLLKGTSVLTADIIDQFHLSVQVFHYRKV